MRNLQEVLSKNHIDKKIKILESLKDMCYNDVVEDESLKINIINLKYN